jgi:hypothetical protein
MTVLFGVNAAYSFLVGAIAAATLNASVGDFDGDFLRATTGWVMLTIFAFLTLWQWENKKFFPLAFIVAIVSLLNIWGDLEFLLEVHVLYDSQWIDGKAPKTPFWLNDWIFYLLIASLIGSTIYIAKYQRDRHF